MHKHMEKNKKDKDSKFRLVLVESRIHRLARYYRRTKQLPANWKSACSEKSSFKSACSEKTQRYENG